MATGIYRQRQPFLLEFIERFIYCRLFETKESDKREKNDGKECTNGSVSISTCFIPVSLSSLAHVFPSMLSWS